MIKEIKINNLEEIAVGNKINEDVIGETIIYNENGEVQTIVELKKDLLYRMRTYNIVNNILDCVNVEEITKKEYDEFLNSIKQQTN
jgi:hypothetical protein